jgi:hypothetical protein
MDARRLRCKRGHGSPKPPPTLSDQKNILHLPKCLWIMKVESTFFTAFLHLTGILSGTKSSFRPWRKTGWGATNISLTPKREASIEYEPCWPGKGFSPHCTGLYSVHFHSSNYTGSIPWWSSCRGLLYSCM